MDDVKNDSQQVSPDATSRPGADGQGPESSSPDTDATKKRINPLVWVGVAAVVLIIGALLLSSSRSGGGLALLFRGGTVTVPLVVGQTEAQAQSLITSAGLRVGQSSQVATLAFAPGTVVSQSPAPDTKVKADSAVDISVAAVPQAKVPDVTGQTESAASATLAEQGLRIGTVSYENDSNVAAGDITAQDPTAGKEVAVGSAVNITISKGKEQGQVPNVVGLAQSDAESTLEGAGFKATSKKTTSSSVPAGDVISQSPAAGVVTAAGSTVTITVSTGAPAPTESAVPNVVGLAQSDAESTLESAGFKATAKQATSSSVPAGDVISQSPEAGVVAAAGSTVTITVSSGAAAPEQPTTPETPPAENPSTKPEPSKVSVPDLLGMGVIDALRTLRDADLKFKIAWDTTEKDILLVIAQDPNAGTEVDPGTAVEITIGLPSFSFEKPEQQPATQPAPTPTPQPSTGTSGGAETTTAP